MADNSRMRLLKADLSLLLIVAIWGTTFPIMKIALNDIQPFYFIGLRFTLAFFVITFLFRKKIKNITAVCLKKGIILGLWLFGGFAFQIVGLQYTTASRSAFITGLSVVLVPLLTVLILKQLPGYLAWLGVVLAILGLFFLTGISEKGIYPGDYLTILCAFSIAMQIVLLSKYLKLVNYILLTWIEIGVVAAGGLFFALINGEIDVMSMGSVVVVIYTGLFASALAFYVQSRAQRYTTSTHTALIFTMEPVFGALFSFLILGEMLGVNGIIGAVLILAGMVLAELNEVKRG